MEDTWGTIGGEGGKEGKENSGGGVSENEVDWNKGTESTPDEDNRGQEPASAISPYNHFGRFLTAEEFVKRHIKVDDTESNKEVDKDDIVDGGEKDEDEEEKIPTDIASPVESVKRTLAIIGM